MVPHNPNWESKMATEHSWAGRKRQRVGNRPKAVRRGLGPLFPDCELPSEDGQRQSGEESGATEATDEGLACRCLASTEQKPKGLLGGTEASEVL